MFFLHKTSVIFDRAWRRCWFLDCNKGYICNYLNIDNNDLAHIIMKKFSGHVYGLSRKFFFLKEENAQQALEWVESQYVAIKLIGKELKDG